MCVCVVSSFMSSEPARPDHFSKAPLLNSVVTGLSMSLTREEEEEGQGHSNHSTQHLVTVQ